MLFLKLALGASLILLLVSRAALAAAQRKGDLRQTRMFHFFRIGLSLSAISYLLRIMDVPHHAPSSLLSFLTCLFGTLFIWRGWLEHWKLRREHLPLPHALRAEDEWDESDRLAGAEAPAVSGGKDTARLNPRAHQALRHAQDEARRRRERCVDTDHLLLGLLRASPCAGLHLLGLLGVSPEKVHLELLEQMVPGRKLAKPSAPTGPLALTERADQVFVLAAQEAHRFDKASLGTEHLLLGLVLVGKGNAAAVLFAEGVSVDALRAEIMRAKKDARAVKEEGRV